MYHSSLTARSVTVTATWVMAGKLAEVDTVCLLVYVAVDIAVTVRAVPSPILPSICPGAHPPSAR